MYAIVNLGGGQYYTSMVYAYYDDGEASDGFFGKYYVVLNREKTALVKHYAFDPKCNPYLHQMILITDSDLNNWNYEKGTGYGEIRSMSKAELHSQIENKTVLPALLEMDANYHFEEYPEIEDETDIDNLMWVAGGFHDAYIMTQNQTDNELYVLFGGVWGCKIEMWFSGDVEYDTSSRTLDDDNPYWFESTMMIEDGFIYLVDVDGIEPADIGEGYCWFKARHVKYHIMPNDY